MILRIRYLVADDKKLILHELRRLKSFAGGCLENNFDGLPFLFGVNHWKISLMSNLSICKIRFSYNLTGKIFQSKQSSQKLSIVSLEIELLLHQLLKAEICFSVLE